MACPGWIASTPSSLETWSAILLQVASPVLVNVVLIARVAKTGAIGAIAAYNAPYQHLASG